MFSRPFLLGTLIAAEYVHPHAHELTDQADNVLEHHEYYAEFTLWASGIGLLLKLLSHFEFRRAFWIEILVGIAHFISAYTVSYAGLLGDQLVHIEGVGPQGDFLEQEEDHEH